MIKEAIEYIVGLSEANELTINGVAYTDKKIHKVETPKISGFQTTTLTSIVDYIKKNPDNLGDKLIISIESPTRVVLKTANIADENYRNVLIAAEPDLPQITFERYLDVETFIIQMQSKFMQTETTSQLMRFVGNVKEEKVRQTSDDGVSQSVVARSGIARVEEVVVPNPVCLKPFRTFLEIDQPESLFVFRMQDGPSMALYNADGGAWKHLAIYRIKEFFEGIEEFKDRIDKGEIVILA